jgi:hypothetical protein
MSNVRHYLFMKNTPETKKPELPKSQRILMEDVNLVRLEGRYFCFNGREAAKRINADLSFPNVNGAAMSVETGKRGQPSILAYRLLQAIFRQITLCGRPYPSTVAFTRRELGRLIGRNSFGGRDAQDILRALYQLQDTHITLVGNNGKTQAFENRFNILVQVCSIWEKDEHALRRQGLLDAIAIELHPAVMRNIAKGQIAIFNWPLLEQLEPLQAALYKRLYLHFSNLYEMNGSRAQGLVFEKAYAAICEEWLGGLHRCNYKSHIENQLLPHLTPLITNGFLAQVTIEPMTKGDGFKLQFKPGPSFFADFEQFYRLKFSKQEASAPLASTMSQPIALVQQFYKTAKGSELPDTSLAKGDIDYALELTALFGFDGAKDFITYGLERAQRTNYQIVSFRGLKVYVLNWQAEVEKRTRQIETDEVRQRATNEIHLQLSYDEHLARHIEHHLTSLGNAERERLEAEAQAHVLRTYGKGLGFAQMVKNQLHRAVLTAAPFPDFETWANMQRR